MPRAFLPLRRKREARSKAELFPRTQEQVVARPPCDRMMRRSEVVDRRLVKRELRGLALNGINSERAKALSTE